MQSMHAARAGRRLQVGGADYGDNYGGDEKSAIRALQVSECNGGPCRIRTYDQKIKSLLLYRLS